MSLIIISVTSFALNLPHSVYMMYYSTTEDPDVAAHTFTQPLGQAVRVFRNFNVALLPCLYFWRYLKGEEVRNTLQQIWARLL